MQLRFKKNTIQRIQSPLTTITFALDHKANPRYCSDGMDHLTEKNPTPAKASDIHYLT